MRVIAQGLPPDSTTVEKVFFYDSDAKCSTWAILLTDFDVSCTEFTI